MEVLMLSYRGVSVVFEYPVAVDPFIIGAVVLPSVGQSAEPHSGVVGHLQGAGRRLRAGGDSGILDVDGRLFESVTFRMVKSPAGGAVDSLVTPVPVVSFVPAGHGWVGDEAKHNRKLVIRSHHTLVPSSLRSQSLSGN